jgi:Fe-S oxidoreductase
MSATKEYGTVHTACEVSFAVGHADYGTILVPVGTKVFRHIIKSRDAAWKPETVKVSDWFVEHDEGVKLCPSEKVRSFYLHDMCHYGITLPNANVRKEGTPVVVHKSHHY